jgi:transposase
MEGNNLAKMVKQQAELIQQLRARIAELEAEIAQLKKNSSNSSKPPSSDIVKPEKPANENGTHEKRKRGAQQGHTRHLRQPFPPSQVDTFVEITLENCPLCGGALEQTVIFGMTLTMTLSVIRDIQISTSKEVLSASLIHEYK